VAFHGSQAQSIAFAFADASKQSDYIFHACSIMPTHIHAVLAARERDVEDIVGHLKFEATRRLTSNGSHPLLPYRQRDGRIPTMWTKRSWKVFLDTPADVMRAIAYVQRNPLKEGKRPQRWSFVKPFGCARDLETPRTRGG
jgi:REP element-mobilizing transposase RayT